MSTKTSPSVGQFLKRFTARDPGLYPGLAFPVKVPVDAKRSLTFASDGETVAVWTAQVGLYRDYAAHGGPDGFSPLEWRGLYRSGCSTPLPAGWQISGKKLVRIHWLTDVAEVPTRWLETLQDFDACWLGGTRAKPATKGGLLPWISFYGVLGTQRFYGVIKCGGNGTTKDTNNTKES